MTRLTIRVDFDNGAALGPGKVMLLETIERSGSIREAAREMRMSYRKAWLLVRSLGDTFGSPLVETSTGGRAGGGARLTGQGQRLVERYRALEAAATRAAAPHLAALTGQLAPGRPPTGGTRRRLRPRSARQKRS